MCNCDCLDESDVETIVDAKLAEQCEHYEEKLAERDERLAWKQVYRACRHVEKLSKGQITVFQHDTHGWMFKQHKSFSSH